MRQVTYTSPDGTRVSRTWYEYTKNTLGAKPSADPEALAVKLDRVVETLARMSQSMAEEGTPAEVLGFWLNTYDDPQHTDDEEGEDGGVVVNGVEYQNPAGGG